MAFSANTLDFLFINKMHNDKVWFNEHRDEYENFVLNPMRSLVADLSQTMLKIDPEIICEPKVNKSISRIFRDTRYSKDKTVFRDVMWCHFLRDKKIYDGVPSFFYEFSPRRIRFGCGYYCMSSEAIDNVRQMILAGNPLFEKANEVIEKSKKYTLADSKYKRSKFPDRSEKEKNWLDQREICVLCENTDFDAFFSENLSKQIIKEFKKLEPVYKFLLKAAQMSEKK